MLLLGVPSEKVDVKVIGGLSGEIVWGPSSVDRDERVSWLRGRLATTFKCEPERLRVFYGSRELEDDDQLASLALTPGLDANHDCYVALESLELTAIRGGDASDAEEVLLRVTEKGAQRLASGEPCISVVDDPVHAVQESEVAAHLADIAAACGCDVLPSDVACWVTLLLTSGKYLQQSVHDGHRMQSITWSAPMTGVAMKHQPGLLCLSAVWIRNYIGQVAEQLIVFLVDLWGALAEIHGQPEVGSGSIWRGAWRAGLGEMAPKVRETFGEKEVPTLEVLRQMHGGQLATPGNEGYNMSCVAPSLWDFFVTMSYTGVAPH